MREHMYQVPVRSDVGNWVVGVAAITSNDARIKAAAIVEDHVLRIPRGAWEAAPCGRWVRVKNLAIGGRGQESNVPALPRVALLQPERMD
jgi:hypothetical protein